MQPGKDAVVQKPADHVTLSAAEGEALIARLAVYAPSRSDCEILIQVLQEVAIDGRIHVEIAAQLAVEGVISPTASLAHLPLER